MFVPQGAFEVLVKKQIEQLKEPSLQCADLILSELQRITAQLETPVRIRACKSRSFLEAATHEFVVILIMNLAAILPSLPQELRQFHLLRQRIVAISSDVLRKGLAPAQKMISDLIDCELACASRHYTRHVLPLISSFRPRHQHEPSGLYRQQSSAAGNEFV